MRVGGRVKNRHAIRATNAFYPLAVCRHPGAAGALREEGRGEGFLMRVERRVKNRHANRATDASFPTISRLNQRPERPFLPNFPQSPLNSYHWNNRYTP